MAQSEQKDRLIDEKVYQAGLAASLPDLSSSDAVTLMIQSADLTLELYADGEITQVICASHFDGAMHRTWIGELLEDVTAQDSRTKLSNLMADKAAVPSYEGRWRHLDLKLGSGQMVPMLLKFFALDHDGAQIRIITARDLSPMMDVHSRFKNEIILLEREHTKLSASIAELCKH